MPPRPRVALVFTRAAEDDVGREKTMRAIREALASCGAVQPFRLHSVAETGEAGDILHAFAVWFWSLICLHPMALQCALFATRISDCQALVDAIKAGGFDAVYIDMVRSQYFLRCLRRAMPQIRIITDLDDLISRRMRFAAMLRLPLSLGFAGRFLTPWLRRLVEGMLPARLVYRYEEQGTAGAEFEMAMASQATVLVSEVERDLLAARLPQAKKGEVHAINYRCLHRSAGMRRLAPNRSVSYLWGPTPTSPTGWRSISCLRYGAGQSRRPPYIFLGARNGRPSLCPAWSGTDSFMI